MTTLFTGVLTALLALVLRARLLCACARAAVDAAHRRAGSRRSLSTPHSAIAIGFAFLVAPSGWIVARDFAVAHRMGASARHRDGRRPRGIRVDARACC